ncbi:photoreceptor cilium actin regulator isoform X1 [Pygocentrus nattereri]|uniref:Photoreceptor cilium actin regulator n=1 Tax=Pygocentrus nattereri TaxID=42514 RepID=A0AAR2LKV8_PYGNA|nr:photoreceptor cilium actin regulator isoform X1 [Pygocentrus nattereri]
MGCSPSKGQLFAGVSAHKALQHESQESNNNNLSEGTEIQSKSETDTVSAELTILEDEPLSGKESALCDVVCETATVVREEVVEETNVDSQEEPLAQDKAGKKEERKKKNKGPKRSKHKERVSKTLHIQSKVDLPEKMVKAHQAAYAYLNPNIPKYESLLGLLDQATQTHLSLQPMVALLALRYEEINQLLEEIAVEGEQMLEEHGKDMAWPAALRDVLFNPAKPNAELYSPEPPPDLLQQMLQHSTEKMKLVEDSVKRLGDAALEEAVDYFASFSRVLEEKLVVKRAAEGRLKQVLDHVEAAALRKSSLEDSALHSEDSGIGADNECQNGSVRLRRHRESSGSGASTGSSSGYPENTLLSQPQLNEVEEDRNNDEEDDDDSEDDSGEDEEEAKEEQGRKTAFMERKMSNCSSNAPQRGRPTNTTLEWTKQRDTNTKRPKTADSRSVISQENPRHSCLSGLRRARSADYLYCMIDGYTVKEQEKCQKSVYAGTDLAGGVIRGSLVRTRLRRHSSEGQNMAQCYSLQYGSKGPFKATLPTGSPPSIMPVPPGRNAVKRLINTFSQGVQDKSIQKTTNVPMKVSRTKRGFLPMLANSIDGDSANDNNNNNIFSIDQRISERPDDMDVDSLPPPPLEVLMDNSFESSEGPPGDEEGSETLNQGCSRQRQRCGVSQRLRASLQMGTVLPSKASVPRRSQSISPARPIRQDAVVGSRKGRDCDQHIGINTEKKEVVSLYQQPQKIIHLHHSSDSPAKAGPGGPMIIRAESVARQGSKDSGENETLMPYPNSYPPTTPPVSRARLPPSCPSVHHRIPSPPALPPCSTSPACGQWAATPYSPNVQRWTRRSSDEENGTSSLSFYDARSVFCQSATGQSLATSCRSTLPRPWGEPSRARLQTSRLPQTFMKSSASGVKPTLIDQQQPLPSATQPHTQDSERRIPASVCEEVQETPASGCVTDPRDSQAVTGAQEAKPNQITDNPD